MGGQVALADPAWGNRTLPEAFERAWIDYPGMGKLGFAVVRPGGGKEANRLAPSPKGLVFLPRRDGRRLPKNNWGHPAGVPIRSRRIWSNRFGFDSRTNPIKKGPKRPFLIGLVEAAGIEPASASPRPTSSTCVVCL